MGSGLSICQLQSTEQGASGAALKEVREVRRINWELVIVAVGVIMLILAILLRVLGAY
jgi:hypothetical protein